jgi:hypothetical protein
MGEGSDPAGDRWLQAVSDLGMSSGMQPMGMQPQPPYPLEQLFQDFGMDDTPPPAPVGSATAALLADGPPGLTARQLHAQVQQGKPPSIEPPVFNGPVDQMLNAPDTLTAAQAHGPDLATASTRAAVMDAYGQGLPEGVAGAQMDFAKFQAAADAGLLTGDQAKRWNAFTAGKTSDEDVQALLGDVQTLGDISSSMTKPDWGKVSGLDFTDSGIAIRVKPAGEVAPHLIDAFKASPNTSLPAPHPDSDLQVVVNPDGSVTGSGAVTAENALQVRHMYPAAANGNSAVWAPGTPLTVTNLREVRDEYAQQLGAEADVVDVAKLRKMDGYWGHRPGNFVVYEADDRSTATRRSRSAPSGPKARSCRSSTVTLRRCHPTRSSVVTVRWPRQRGPCFRQLRKQLPGRLASSRSTRATLSWCSASPRTRRRSSQAHQW